MNGTGRLIQNELVKTVRQLSWKIIAIIFLVFAIIGPILTHVVVNALSNVGPFIESLIPAGEEGTVEHEYDIFLDEVDSFFEDLEIDMLDWRYDLYYSDYRILSESVRGLELIKDGRSPEEVVEWFYINNVVGHYDEDMYITRVTYHADGNTDSEGVPMTAEIAAEAFRRETTELESLKKEISEANISSIANGYILTLETELNTLRDTFSTLEDELKSNKNVIFDYETAKYDIEALKAELDVWKVIADCEENDEFWLLTSVSLIEGIRSNITTYAVVDENTFEKDADFVEAFGNYEYYLERMRAGYESCHGAIETVLYSVTHKLPLPDTLQSSTRSYVSGSISSSISNTTFICLILAATILSTEYSSGSIRLLLIRPRARWKILFSKIACVVIYGAVLFLASSILSTVTHIIIVGAGDLNIPYLTYSNGAVRENMPFLYMIGQALISVLPDMFFISLALLFSVTLKKVVFAVAFPILADGVCSVIAEISKNYLVKLPILKYTIFPYLDMSQLLTDNIRDVSYGMANMSLSGIFSDVPMTPVDLSVGAGVIIILVHICIITAVSFIVFRKQQIKS